MTETKRGMRSRYLQMRSQLSMQEMHQCLALMVEWFREIPLPIGALVLSYKAMVQKNEVNPEVFEEVMFEEYGAKGLCFPAVDFSRGRMDLYLEDDHLKWEEVRFGLTQPAADSTLVLPDEPDVIFVPLLAFDKQGNRLGYGKGFYDGFLPLCRPAVPRIGLSWFEAEESIPEIAPHDVPLNYCVTPSRLYVF